MAEKVTSLKTKAEPVDATTEQSAKRSKHEKTAEPGVPKQQIPRPGYGKMGRQVRIVANHFLVKFQPRTAVTHYSCKVYVTSDENRPLRSTVKRKVVDALRDNIDFKGLPFAYDGDQNLYVAGQLEIRLKEYQVSLPADHRRASPTFNVELAYAAVIDMATMAAVIRGEPDKRAQDALRVLDIIIREHASKKGNILQRDCFFSKAFGRVVDLQGGAETWKGYHASFKLNQNGLSLNLDTATTIMIKESKVEAFVEELCRKKTRQFTDEDYGKCKRALKGILIHNEHQKERNHKILGFSPAANSSQTFRMKKKNSPDTIDDFEEITVADYYTKVKGVALKAPFQRALDVGRKGRPTYFPMEHCSIAPGQRYRRALTTIQRQGMIRECKQNPDQRVRAIDAMMQTNKFHDDEMVKAFDVRIDDKMVRLEGRVLDPPQLQFAKNHRETPRNGRWNFNVDRQMNRPASTSKWIVVWFKSRRTLRLDTKKIGSDLVDVAAKKGMKLGAFEVFEEGDGDHERRSPAQRVDAMIDRLRDAVRDARGAPVPAARWPLIVAILPEKSPDLYVPFKKICETQIGVVTQCIVPPNGQANAKYLSSVCLKLNLKLGGYNSVLAGEDGKTLPKISLVPTIIFGLDVSHGPPGDCDSPSVAAAVATVEWPRFSRYACSIRAQKPKEEIVAGLFQKTGDGRDAGMVQELLMQFFLKSAAAGRPLEERKPRQILVFRDGVSESQFREVLDQEVGAFKAACRALEKDYDPRITFVVVQKKHHTRFFQDAQFGNVAPGTVVDRVVCHPRHYDFYMVSHAAIGTSRPTHYHVLCDEIGFSADDIQQLTHGLCYTYSRCTSAVSVVAPAYYAHVAAAHCRNFVDTSDSSSDSTVRAAEHDERCLSALPKIHDNVLQKMFYA
ncbi:eukaryotic translation initiation factor 2C [Marchantia polymorpha subsp. ruderalis]|nr:hypothetical protein MARPO_0045s0024 [Marchantia polymorpha]BBN15542.1 hypothetical protein Mp_6g20400 [Marchantia polymorpha subsp. ruderalis]|eukprot:PTQ39347.1 hypothetical protein MARPO_0045s0024 [Marchantia polymorpha]